jgi:hypothetical protein
MFMQLKYHQATYDLLTKTRINPDRFIANYEQYHHTMLQAELSAGSDPQETQQRFDEQSHKQLDWTKLELFQHPIRYSQRNLDELDTFEQTHNLKLPASVREWYSLDIAPEIMGSASLFWLSPSEMEPYPDHTCYFMHHEYFDQGGERLVFKLDAGDDPPVLAQIYDDELRLIEPTFSQFLYCHFWDWHSSYMFPYWFDIVHAPEYLGPPDVLKVPERFFKPVRHLRNLFAEIQSHHQLRFYSSNQRIRAYNLRWSPTEQVKDVVTGGVFRAESLDALEQLIDTVWGEDAPLFKMSQWEHDETKQMLTRKQYSRIRQVLAKEEDWMTESELATALGSPSKRMEPAIKQKVETLVKQGEVETYSTDTESFYRLKPIH